MAWRFVLDKFWLSHATVIVVPVVQCCSIQKNQDKSKEQLIYKMLKQPQGENSETEADCSSRTERG